MRVKYIQQGCLDHFREIVIDVPDGASDDEIRRIGEEAIYFEEWEDGAWKLVDEQIETLDEGEMERKGPDSA